jgi:hypothetical protein
MIKSIADTYFPGTFFAGRIATLCCVLGLAMAELVGLTPLSPPLKQAHAIVGAPWTPVSVAGAARRTYVRRSTIYLNALPAGCAMVRVGDVSVWKCGGTYYQPYRGRYVVVYLR